MAALGLEVFDRTVQASTIWVDEICDLLAWTDRRHGYHALRVGLQALRDHLPAAVAVHLAAQFPVLIRGMFYEGWNLEHVPDSDRRSEGFLAKINEAFALECDADPTEITQAVMQLLSRHISAGEIEKVKHCLPTGIRQLWPRTDPTGEVL